MDHFDSQIKKHLKNQLDKNVHFSMDNKEHITQSLMQKRRHPFIIKALTILVFSLMLILAISLPVWFQSQNSITMRQSVSPLSELNISVKEIIPEGFFKEQEKGENNTIIKGDEEANGQNEHTPSDSTSDDSNDNENVSPDSADEKEKNQSKTVDKEIFIQLVEKFNSMGDYLTEGMTFDESITPDGAYVSKTFSSKNEYYNYLSDYMTYDLAKELWGYRLVEHDDKLGVIPMDGHVTFLLDQPYTIERRSNTEYFITQEQTTDLYGRIQLTVYFIFQEDQWLISEIEKK
ncbi:hypothetical protein ACTWP4_02890 [Gracilibacillus sp. D59]|uniref:hypothetical protein n=1 Tax=Gracilibacillus sp. D59 TaxID=3457434 RepID=UPI003FCCC7BF